MIDASMHAISDARPTSVSDHGSNSGRAAVMTTAAPDVASLANDRYSFGSFLSWSAAGNSGRPLVFDGFRSPLCV